MNGYKYEARSLSRNEGRSGRRSVPRSGGCCGRRNEGRLGGKDSPRCPEDSENPDNAEIRMLIPEVRTRGRGRTWDTTAGAKSDVRRHCARMKDEG